MSLTRLAGLALLLVALVAGCARFGGGLPPAPTPAGGGASPTAPQPTQATQATQPPVAPSLAPSPTAAPTEVPDDGAQVVEVALQDSMQIVPGKITVESGTPVRFVITNEGALEHDFFIGSDREQKQREAGEGEPGPDRYVAVPPGETVTLVTTFPSPGKTIAGCVVPGHYSAGMKATITIE